MELERIVFEPFFAFKNGSKLIQFHLVPKRIEIERLIPKRIENVLNKGSPVYGRLKY
jgi:hypothetical protein